MRIYLDVSSLNRPFDDQSQSRIRLEAEAILFILAECDEGAWHQVSSEMATIEVDAIPDPTRRRRVRLLLPARRTMLKLTLGLLARNARRNHAKLKVRVSNPVDWLKEIGRETDAG